MNAVPSKGKFILKAITLFDDPNRGNNLCIWHPFIGEYKAFKERNVVVRKFQEVIIELALIEVVPLKFKVEIKGPVFA